MGNFNESIQDINKTLTLEPRHFGALDGLGQIQFKLNNFYESIQTYEKLLTIVPHSSSAKKMLELMNAQFI
jgi:tetratricopeptide (TPR) repeat protein